MSHLLKSGNNCGKWGRSGGSGPRINKQLYSEAADVAAWPAAEVDAWRAQRGMVVEGADIKPITRFDQGGARPRETQTPLTFVPHTLAQ